MPEAHDMNEEQKVLKPIIPISYIGSLCELQDEKNKFIAHCRIKDIVKHTFELVQTEEDAIDPGMPYGFPVKMNIYDPKLGIMILSGINHSYSDGVIKIIGAMILLGSERREFFRVPTRLNGVVRREAATNPLYKGMPPPKKPLLKQPSSKQPNKEEIKVTVGDISLSGLQFTSSENFAVGDRVSVEIKPLDNVMRFPCEIVRKKVENEEMFYYGCNFLQLAEFEISELSKIIMKLQQLNRAMMRDVDLRR